MCVYCMIGDWHFRHNPPWPPNQYPQWPQQIPAPSIPPTHIVPWDINKLNEFAGLLRRVKELEDKLGCPCEPNKADYLDLLKKRIETLEQKFGEMG